MNLEDASTTSGFDDIGEGTTWAFLTLDAQWNDSALPTVKDSAILGARLNISF